MQDNILLYIDVLGFSDLVFENNDSNQYNHLFESIFFIQKTIRGDLDPHNFFWNQIQKPLYSQTHLLSHTKLTNN
jgi:hypothetical protein